MGKKVPGSIISGETLASLWVLLELSAGVVLEHLAQLGSAEGSSSMAGTVLQWVHLFLWVRFQRNRCSYRFSAPQELGVISHAT